MTDTDAMRRLAAEKFPTGPADLLERLFAMRDTLTEAASEIERLRENQRTDFSIEHCDQCGLDWDGKWPSEKCYYVNATDLGKKFCPIQRASAAAITSNGHRCIQSK